MVINSIDEVIKMLDNIIEKSIVNNDRVAIFASIYKRTTEKIKEGIDQRIFDDNDRMEDFDIVFASRYINAWLQFKAGAPLSQSWLEVFKVKDNSLTIVQHIILGMNAHMKLDLGVSTAQVASGEQIHTIKNDFMKVNDILTILVDELQNRLNKVSRLMFLLDWFGGSKDEKLLGFGIKRVRDKSWEFARQLAPLTGEAKSNLINKVDERIAKLNRSVHKPSGKVLPFVLKVIRALEEKNIKRIVDGLGNPK